MTTPASVHISALPELSSLRGPELGEPGPLGRLGAATAAAARAAEARVERLLPGLDLCGRAADPRATSPAVGRWRSADLDAGALGVLAALTEERLAAAPLAFDGIEPSLVAGRGARLPVVLDALAAGAEVRLEQVTDLVPAVAALGDDIVSVLAARVGLTLVLAGPRLDAAGAWHDEDRIILVLQGERRVELTPPTVPGPIPGATAGPEGPPSDTVDLGPGQALLVPRGWGWTHRGNDLAVWAELAARRLRGTDVAALVARRAGGAAPFREDAPWDPLSVPPRPDSAFGVPDGLARRFGELDLEALGAAAVADWQARLTPVSRPPLGDLLDDAPPGPPWAPGGLLVAEALGPDRAPPVGGEVALAAAGKLLVCPPDVVDQLVDGRDVPAVRRLVAEGLLVPAPMPLAHDDERP
ncbi:MAG TPA: hypothetical protein VHK88_05795 [Aquihabitans sp.]|jgi:hypothetical protein|nr:hypothetical protein [Aquihabitans sp.]